MVEDSAPMGNKPQNEDEKNSDMEVDSEQEEETDDTEDMTPEEFDALNNQLDALNSALDDIEEKNDHIHAQLLQLLEENREIRRQLKESNTPSENSSGPT